MAVARNPLTTSRKRFKEDIIQVESRTSRWRIIQVLAEMKPAIKKPPLTMNHKERRVEFAVNYIKQEFDKVMFTDECRATLDGPDEFSRGWVLNQLDRLLGYLGYDHSKAEKGSCFGQQFLGLNS